MQFPQKTVVLKELKDLLLPIKGGHSSLAPWISPSFSLSGCLLLVNLAKFHNFNNFLPYFLRSLSHVLIFNPTMGAKLQWVVWKLCHCQLFIVCSRRKRFIKNFVHRATKFVGIPTRGFLTILKCTLKSMKSACAYVN